MTWISRDNARMKDLNFFQSLRATIGYYLYRFIVNPLADRGFLKTEEAAKFRWRHFTLKPWKTMEQRYINTIEILDERIELLNEKLAWEVMAVRSQQVQTSIIVAGIVKAAGGEIIVKVGDLLHRDTIETFRDPIKDTITYRIVENDV